MHGLERARDLAHTWARASTLLTLRCSVISLLVCVCGAAGDPAQERQDSIVVTGAYEPLPLEEADRTVTPFEIGKRLLVLNTVTDLLRLDPSLDLRQRSPDGVQSDLSIRGGTFGQTLVLVDGLRLNDVQTGHHNLDVPVPVDALARIEILRGSGSTLYGSDAAGGVVNFVTRTPEASQFRLRTAAGNFGVNQERAALSLVKSWFAQELTATRDFSSGFMPDRDYRNLSLLSNSHITTSLGATAILLAHGDRPFGAQNFYGAYPSWERTKTWFASMRQDLGAKTQGAFAFRRHTDLFVLYRDRPGLFTNRHAVESYQATLRRRENLGRNTKIHYGAEGLRDSIVSSNLGSHSRTSGAAYAAADFRALGRFSFSAGVREQVHGGLRSEVSPSLAGGIWFSQRLRLRSSVSRAFRLPSYTDLYYHDPASVGSPDLRPERAWSYEAGLEWNPGRRLRGDVTVFHRRESDGIDYVRRSETDIWRATNIQRLRFTGVETLLAARIHTSQQVEFRYTGLRGSGAALGGLVSRYVFNYPVHSGVAAWQGALWGGLLGRVRVGAVQRLGRDAYTTLDVYLARSGRRLRPFLQLTNLTDASHEEILGVRMPGRGIVGGLEWVVFGPPN